MDLAIKAVATSAAGFYYREEHEWRGLSAEAATQFEAKGQQAAVQAKAAAGSKEDGANITLTLSSVVDGKPQPDVVVSGLSQIAFTKLQRKAHNEADAILSMGEKGAKAKGQHGNR